MALELKGIKADALLARGNIDNLKTAYRKLAQSSGDHLGDVNGLVKDVTGMQEDLNAIVDITKNSVASSNAGVEQVENPVVVPQGVISPDTHTRNSNGSVIENH